MPVALLEESFGPGAVAEVVSVPGRVNLLGEHIDYHGLAVLPMAIQRSLKVAFRRRPDRRIRVVSQGFAPCSVEWTTTLTADARGDWSNYVKAAAQAAGAAWRLDRGIDAAVLSDLPAAAGLSSSSALLTGVVLALLRANELSATFEELMNVLPEAEHFVGTRGGGMDHAAVLAARRGCALQVEFEPLRTTPIPIPDHWSFLIAHSLSTAEKSGGALEEYNSRRRAGTRALQQLGFANFAEAAARFPCNVAGLDEEARRCFLHVVTEAVRVTRGVDALRQDDAPAFGAAMNESHDSLRDDLQVSTPALDMLVDCARSGGAIGARLTGAGFGGCAVMLCPRSRRDYLRHHLMGAYYRDKPRFDPEMHLIAVEPSEGALGL